MMRQSAKTATNAFQVLIRSNNRITALVPMPPLVSSSEIPLCVCASYLCIMERQRRPFAI
jgi:hypothetical protein